MITPRDPAPVSASGAVSPRRHSLWSRLTSSVRARRWLRRSEGLSTREASARYALAIVLALAAIALKGVVDTYLGNSTGFLSYVGAVIIAAWFGGLGGGLIVTFISAAGQAIVFDVSAATPLTSVEVVRLAWFIGDGVLLAIVASGLRRASVAHQAARAQVTDLLGAVVRFKATVDASLEAVFMFDPQSLLVTYANRGAGELLGAEPDAIVGRQIADLQPMLGGEVALREELQPLAQDATDAVRYTSVIERDDGRHVPFQATVQHVRLPGEPGTMVLTARDISERIEVQARLARVASDERRQAAELRAVIQAMGEAVLVVAPRGDIRLANDAARAMLGTVPTVLSELPGLLGVAEGDLPRLGVFHAAQVIPVRDGGWLEVAAYLTDAIGTEAEGHSTILILRDVTSARQAEQAREAFIGVLSHELRTPVTTIYGYAKVLRRPRKTLPTDMLADIEIEADRLYRIVEDLLALSRVEGGITVAGEPLLIQHLAEALVTSEAQRWPAIHFEAEVPRDLPPAFGERTYVEQVLRNLLSNAAKYSPPDSTVLLLASSTAADVEVRVLDRGAGITEGESDQLFRLYYRSPRTARQATGAGIGLYVSRELIHAMGGRIWATPREGGGSEFGFSLPRCEEA